MATGYRFAADGLVKAGPFFWPRSCHNSAVETIARGAKQFFVLGAKHRATMRRTLSALACFALTACAPASQRGAEPDLWDRLARGGTILLMAHANAPSPQAVTPEFATRRCAGQDHLSEQGRIAAQQLADKLRDHAVSVGRVLTSHDCRSIETAAIVFGRAEPWSVMDDTRIDDAESLRDKSIALREAISRWASSENLALVSHQSNIKAALGVTTKPAEIVIIEPLGDRGFRLRGTLPSE